MLVRRDEGPTVANRQCRPDAIFKPAHTHAMSLRLTGFRASKIVA